MHEFVLNREIGEIFQEPPEKLRPAGKKVGDILYQVERGNPEPVFWHWDGDGWERCFLSDKSDPEVVEWFRFDVEVSRGGVPYGDGPGMVPPDVKTQPRYKKNPELWKS